MAEKNEEEKEVVDSIEFVKEKIGICQHNMVKAKESRMLLLQKTRIEEDKLNDTIAYWEMQVDRYQTLLETIRNAERNDGK